MQEFAVRLNFSSPAINRLWLAIRDLYLCGSDKVSSPKAAIVLEQEPGEALWPPSYSEVESALSFINQIGTELQSHLAEIQSLLSLFVLGIKPHVGCMLGKY